MHMNHLLSCTNILFHIDNMDACELRFIRIVDSCHERKITRTLNVVFEFNSKESISIQVRSSAQDRKQIEYY